MKRFLAACMAAILVPPGHAAHAASYTHSCMGIFPLGKNQPYGLRWNVIDRAGSYSTFTGYYDGYNGHLPVRGKIATPPIDGLQSVSFQTTVKVIGTVEKHTGLLYSKAGRLKWIVIFADPDAMGGAKDLSVRVIHCQR